MRLARLILTVLLSVALTFTGTVATAAAHCDETSEVSPTVGPHHGAPPQDEANEQGVLQHEHVATDKWDDGTSMRAASACSHCAFCQSCASPSLAAVTPGLPLHEIDALAKSSLTQRVTQFFADFPDRPPRAALA